MYFFEQTGSAIFCLNYFSAAEMSVTENHTHREDGTVFIHISITQKRRRKYKIFFSLFSMLFVYFFRFFEFLFLFCLHFGLCLHTKPKIKISHGTVTACFGRCGYCFLGCQQKVLMFFIV